MYPRNLLSAQAGQTLVASGTTFWGTPSQLLQETLKRLGSGRKKIRCGMKLTTRWPLEWSREELFFFNNLFHKNQFPLQKYFCPVSGQPGLCGLFVFAVLAS